MAAFWQRWSRALFPRSSRRKPIRRLPLRLEALEARVVPAVLTVNSLLDTDPTGQVLTLRDAVALTNGSLNLASLSANEQAQVSGTLGSSDRIQFGVTGEIDLMTALPALGNVQVLGPGADKLTVERASGAGTNFSVFTLTSSVTAVLSGLSIRQGVAGNNQGLQAGGGIYVGSGNLTVNDCTIDGNYAAYDGGGIFNAFGVVTINRSTLSNNSAGAFGGAIYNNSASTTISDSTIARNSAASYGGGIFNVGSLVVANSTIAANTGAAGGGVVNESSWTVQNTIVANNTASFANDVWLPAGTLLSQGHNLIGDTTGSSGWNSGNGDLLNVDPLLTALANNGGTMQTMALQANSPALDAGDPAFVSPPATDQRGLPRVTNGRLDIGAFEFTNFTGTTVVASTPTSTYGDNVTFTATVTNAGSPVSSGSVTFAEGATVLGTVTVDGNGQASLALSTLAAGGHTIVASFTSSAYAPSSASVGETVSRASLTVTANDVTNHVYGSPYTGLTVSYTAFGNGEDASVLGGGLSYVLSVSSHVGTYPNSITPSGLTSSNYQITFVRGSLTTTPATLTYTAAAATRNYGATNPVLTGTVTGFKGPDTLSSATTGTLTFTTTATSASDVGSYAVTGSGWTARFGDYVFVQAASNATALTITSTALTITANDATRVYGGTDPVLSVGYVGLVLGQGASVLAGALALATSTTANSNAGTYAGAITASGLTSTNYAITYVAGAMSITPATLTYTANAVSKIYGDAIPALSGTVSGFVLGQDQTSATTGVPTFTTTATASTDVGFYAIKGSGLSANNGNYTFIQAAGNASALHITAAPLTITATDAGRSYGAANPTFFVTYDGFVLGQGPTNLGGHLRFATTTSANSDVGIYAGDFRPFGVGADDYAITFVNGTLTITPAMLSYVADPVSRPYGAFNPPLTGTVTGFVLGQDQASATTGILTFITAADAASSVGSYGIVGSGLTAIAGNYTFGQDPNNTTALTVTPLDVTVTSVTTAEDTQSAGITIDASGATAVPFFQITNITGGRLYLADGITPVHAGDYVPAVAGVAVVRFTPAADANSPAGDVFGFQAQAALDSLGSLLNASAGASITVTEVNDAPIAGNDTLPDIAEDSGALSIPAATLLANDQPGPSNESGQTLTIIQVGNAVGGSVQLIGGNVIFTPAANFFGAAQFDYTVQDNGTTHGVSDPRSRVGTVTFAVDPVADTPSVTGATTFVNQQTGSGLVITPNPVDGSSVTYFKITNITNGTLFEHDGVTPIANDTFIVANTGLAGLKFTPAASQANPGTTFSFEVQAATGNADADPGGNVVTATIAVSDPTAPRTSIDSTPATLTSSPSATFTFSGTDNVTPPAQLHFQVKLDAGPWTAASSPVTFTGLADGTHLFQVRAIDAAGNVDENPPFYTWTVDTIAPTVKLSAPSVKTTAGGPIRFDVTYADLHFHGSTLSASDVILNRSGTANADVVVTGSGTQWHVTLMNVTGKGTLGISLAAGTASDNAGNHAAAAGPSATATIAGAAVLKISQNKPPASLRPGNTYAFVINIANTGNQVAPGTVITDYLPAGAVFNAALSTAGWVNHGGGRFTFDLATLAAGARRTLSFGVTFPITIKRPTPMTNRVTITDALVKNQAALATSLASLIINPLGRGQRPLGIY
jgi:uncharacterized repeat protein (TIGR01451 family)